MARKRYNNQSGTLTAQILAAATSFTSVNLQYLPVVTAPDVVAVTIDPGVVNTTEIVYITDHTASAQTAVIQRAREGTTAVTHNAAAVWRHGPTVQDFEDFLVDGVTLEAVAGVHRIKDLGVTAQKIQNLTITGAQIANATIAGTKLIADTIGAGQIAAGAIGTSELAANAVDSTKILDGAVGQAELANGAVTAAKLDPLAGVPTGCIMAFAGPSPPAGWVLCNGAALNRATYSALYGIIGTTYGAGDGALTFNVPDFRGRSVLGAGTSPVDDNGTSLSFARGDTAGEYRHTLTTAELAQHTHTQVGHTHIQSAHGHTQDPHTHIQNQHRHGPGIGSNFVTFEGSGSAGLSIATGGTEYSVTAYTTPTNQNTTATNNDNTAVNQITVATNNNTGSNASHTNTSPYGVAQYIIKT